MCRFVAETEKERLLHISFANVAIKRVIDARWSARYAAVKALHARIYGVVNELDQSFFNFFGHAP